MSRTLGGGRYQLHEQLGQGGMASVWRATDTLLAVDRAVKLLSPEGERRPEVALRFVNEARLLARIRHPRIVQVYDVGADDGRSWYVMELLPGGSLFTRLRETGALPPEWAVDRVLEVLDGLAAIHGAGVVHRDVKPQNVLLAADGGACLADFGIARDDTGDRLTRTGEALGTATFMAPEQYEDTKSADHRADLYAVGATLYALVTMQRPFDLYNAELAPEVYRRVPPPLRPVIQRATRFDPDERYASAPEMAADLRAARAALASAPAVPRRSRGRVAALAAVGVVGAAVLLLGTALGSRREPVPPPPAEPRPPPAPVVEAAPVAPPSEPVAPPPIDTRLPRVPPAVEVASRPRPAPAPREVPAPPPPPPEPDARLFVNSVPPGTVRIDGVLRGPTPVEIEVVHGSHRVEIEHADLPAVVRTLAVPVGERTVFCWDLATGAPCPRR